MFDFYIEINNTKIKRVKQVIFLGIVLDENLSWNPHISHISRKISKSIGVIYKSSFCLPKSCLRSLYFSLIYPYLHYCILVWGSTYKSNLNRIVLLQKRIIRIINKKEYDAHAPLFKQSMILKLNDIYLFCLGKFMYLASKNYLPPSLKNLFLINSQMHNYNTRSSKQINIPFCRTRLRQFTVFYQGAVFFNSLDESLQNASSVYSSQSKLKKYLIFDISDNTC